MSERIDGVNDFVQRFGGNQIPCLDGKASEVCG